MKPGFIGAGQVAQTYAKHLARHGHEVMQRSSKPQYSGGELDAKIFRTTAQTRPAYVGR